MQRIHLALTAAALFFCGACASIPPGRSAVEDVDISGGKALDGEDVEEKIATNPSPRFLGLFEGVVYDYQIFDRFVLERDLARVERYYRARGYYEAHARAGRVRSTRASHVRVEIFVEEGTPVLMGDVVIDGLEGLPKPVVVAAEAAAKAKLVHAQPFDEDNFTAGENDLRLALQDQGYAYAKVTRESTVDLVLHRADVKFTVVPDKPAVFGKIIIEGLGSLPETPVRRALNLKEGATFSTTELESAQQAALDLGVFASVAMHPDIGDPPPASHVVPVTVRVEPAKLRTVKLGGGFEIDGIKTDVHAILRWENRNFLGGLRSFSASFRPGVVLYPTRIDNLVAPTDLLPTGRLRLELRQPGFIEARTSGFLRPELNIFPLLLRAAGSNDPNVPVPGYREIKGAVGADRTFLKFFYANLSENVQVENPFTYKGAKDANVRDLFLSYPALITNFDFRDDRVHPHKGIYIGNDVQVAGLVGDASDVRVQPEIRAYVPLSRRVTLASRVKLGFLFPSNYGSHIDPATSLPAAGASTADWARDLQLIYFRGFYSGGPSSNRGYALGDVGPHGAVPFFDPGLDARQYQRSCDPGSPSFSATNCAVPLKGLTLWEASVEVRFPVIKNFEGAIFCDTSDVSPRRTEIRLTHLHLSCGAGGRYETPVGPIRLDIGYRIVDIIGAHDVVECATVSGGQCTSYAPLQSTQEGVHSKLFGVPLAIAFGIGEAF